MACRSSLTGLALNAAGALVTNGAASSIFGDAPISSVAGVPITDFDGLTGEQLSPTLATMVTSTDSITGTSWYNVLDSTVANIATLPTSLQTEWNSLASGLGDDVFSAGLDLFSGNALGVMGNISGAVDEVIKYGKDWAKDNLGGTLVGNNIVADPGIFGTVVSTVDGYISEANNLIGAAFDLENNTGLNINTFSSIGSTMTAGLEGVSLDLSGLGSDLLKVGKAINFQSLENLGSPGQLLANMAEAGSLGPLASRLQTLEIDERTARSLGANIVGPVLAEFAQGKNVPLGRLGIDINSIAQRGGTGGLTPGFEGYIYDFLDELPPEEVNDIKQILGTSTPGIVSGTDFLNPAKLLPNSFNTLTAPFKVGSVGERAIYLDDQGTINTLLEEYGERLQYVLPADLAIANGALSASLRQVKGIFRTDSTALGTALSTIESTKDLPLIEAETAVASTSVLNYWLDSYATSSNINLASGTANTLVLSDVIGYAAGYNSAAPLSQNANVIADLQSAGELNSLYVDNGSANATTGILPVVNYLIDGTYGAGTTITIPAGVYGEGTYTGANAAAALANAWSNGIIPATQTLLQTMYSGNTQIQTVQANHKRVQEQLAREKLNQDRLDFDATTLVTDQTVSLELAQNLSSYGTDTAAGGKAEYLERVVNYNTLGGQSIIGTMREPRNKQRLDLAQVSEDFTLENDVTQTEATLLDSQYTKTDALDSIIKS